MIRVTRSRFHDAVELLLADEGGFVQHPRDPGGATNMGITIRTLADWRGAKVTVQDVRDLTRDEARRIYFARYWNVVRGDELPAGLDYMVFDFGVNAGTGRSARFLQTIAGNIAREDIDVDGVIGPVTVATVQACQPAALIEEFHAAKMRHYTGLDTWSVFGKGWTRRATKVLSHARAMAGYRPEVGAA